MKNRVRQLRIELDLSQRKLAELVGTSQQQIQRIEAGRVAARLEMAIKISGALGKPLDIVFPGSSKALQKLDKEMRTSRYFPDEAFPEVSESGVEADPRIWFFKMLLRGHEKPIVFEIPGAEQRRLFAAVQDEKGDDIGVSFVVFDTNMERIAVNLGEIVFCHFLFEQGDIIREIKEDVPQEMQICFCGNRESYQFDSERDEGDPDDDDDPGEIRHIFYMMQAYAEKHERYNFVDAGGETVFLRAGDIALMRVPLWVVEPRDLDEEDDE